MNESTMGKIKEEEEKVENKIKTEHHELMMRRKKTNKRN
jgi:hypothetical protein